MEGFTVRQGGLFPLQITQSDSTSISATIILKNQATDVVITKSADYVDGVADLTLDSTETGVVGTYDIQVNENYTSGDPIKFPEPDDCLDDCSFPTLEICEALDEVQVS